MEERIKDFLSVSNGSGAGYGSGAGSGDGAGYGYGAGYGSGDGSGSGAGYGYGAGYGSGDGSGSGAGYGYGDGAGSGAGYGYGDGAGYGYGDGAGYGYGVNSINGRTVYKIDGVQTLIDRIRGNIAKGHILNADLTLTPCYIVKNGNFFAHGETVKEAIEAVREKVFEGASEEERIDAFVEEYPKPDIIVSVSDLYKWHNRLTGSCEMGRKQFAKDHNLDIEHDKMTVSEFIELTKNAYGGETIKSLEERYDVDEKRGK